MWWTRWYLLCLFVCFIPGNVKSVEYATQLEVSEVHINVVPKSEETEEFILDYEDSELIEKDINDVNSGENRNLGCPIWEEYLQCGPTCQITCETLGLSCPSGPCQRGCYCKLGKVRSVQTGKCISQKYCQGKFLLSDEYLVSKLNKIKF